MSQIHQPFRRPVYTDACCRVQRATEKRRPALRQGLPGLVSSDGKKSKLVGMICRIVAMQVAMGLLMCIAIFMAMTMIGDLLGDQGGVPGTFSRGECR